MRFRPLLLRAGEFLEQPAEFRYFDVNGSDRSLALSAGSLAFTFCQVPVIYQRVTGKAWIHVTFADGSSAEHAGNMLDARAERGTLLPQRPDRQHPGRDTGSTALSALSEIRQRTARTASHNRR